jgi:type II protein arginine methyltransferase
MSGGEQAKALALVEQVLNDDPDNPELQSVAHDVLTCGIPGWHRTMLLDGERNGAFARAIHRAVADGGTMLDVGTGSGLLALIGARAGATRVYACELSPALAATARQIVADNGYAQKVDVLNVHSTDLDAERDLDGGVDVIVGEVFSNDLLGEGALRAFQHAASSLARRGAQIIPARASIRIALVNYEQSEIDLADMCGFNITRFGRHLHQSHAVSVGSERLQLSSDPANLFSFDFSLSAAFKNERTRVSLKATGPANGVARWIQLRLDDHEVYENLPSVGRKSAWDLLFSRLPRNVTVGDTVSVHAAHDREHVHLWFS